MPWSTLCKRHILTSEQTIEMYDKSIPAACVLCSEPIELQRHFHTTEAPTLGYWIGKRALPGMPQLLINGPFEWSLSRTQLMDHLRKAAE